MDELCRDHITELCGGTVGLFGVGRGGWVFYFLKPDHRASGCRDAVHLVAGGGGFGTLFASDPEGGRGNVDRRCGEGLVVHADLVVYFLVGALRSTHTSLVIPGESNPLLRVSSSDESYLAPFYSMPSVNIFVLQVKHISPPEKR